MRIVDKSADKIELRNASSKTTYTSIMTRNLSCCNLGYELNCPDETSCTCSVKLCLAVIDSLHLNRRSKAGNDSRRRCSLNSVIHILTSLDHLFGCVENSILARGSSGLSFLMSLTACICCSTLPLALRGITKRS